MLCVQAKETLGARMGSAFDPAERRLVPAGERLEFDWYPRADEATIGRVAAVSWASAPPHPPPTQVVPAPAAPANATEPLYFLGGVKVEWVAQPPGSRVSLSCVARLSPAPAA